jgi:hypothetical protein
MRPRRADGAGVCHPTLWFAESGGVRTGGDQIPPGCAETVYDSEGHPEAYRVAATVSILRGRGYQGRSFGVFAALASNDDGSEVLFLSVPTEADRQRTQLHGVLQGLGATSETPVTILSEGAEEPRSLGDTASIGPVQYVLDCSISRCAFSMLPRASRAGQMPPTAIVRKARVSPTLSSISDDGCGTNWPPIHATRMPLALEVLAGCGELHRPARQHRLQVHVRECRADCLGVGAGRGPHRGGDNVCRWRNPRLPPAARTAPVGSPRGRRRRTASRVARGRSQFRTSVPIRLSA